MNLIFLNLHKYFLHLHSVLNGRSDKKIRVRIYANANVYFYVYMRLFSIFFILIAASVIGDKRTNVMEEDSDRSRAHKENSNAPYYEPLNVLSEQNVNIRPTYEQLTTSANVGVIEHGLSERATYENFEHKLNANEPSFTEYESLQHGKLTPSDEYETIKPKQLIGH